MTALENSVKSFSAFQKCGIGGGVYSKLLMAKALSVVGEWNLNRIGKVFFATHIRKAKEAAHG